ncbi:hypothetical protein SAMN05421548_1567 [Paraburkholderia lycopersici]|uniref:Uncharacterized protein n=1 Tax=Paraburkholderia lycopersici TaxID=416944 RepID=A0A1G7DBQ6_9BURK|nr:hypothetical protein SAMN05421548_1567 [Paraburkholderia lycopersici]
MPAAGAGLGARERAVTDDSAARKKEKPATKAGLNHVKGDMEETRSV